MEAKTFVFLIVFILFGFYGQLDLQSISHDTCSSKSEPSCSSNQGVQSKDFSNTKHINIIFFGATGNLAKKYLWNSLYEAYQHFSKKNEGYKFSIYAASRDDKKKGRKFISDFLLNLGKCEDDTCQNLKKGFSETIQYVQLKTSDHFKDLAMKINENTQSLYGLKGSPNTYEIGRLFYLAIPPSAYSETAERIHKYLMPEIGRCWVRIVVEKPFGRDLESAKLLNSGLLKNFDESQIYRVDHYLGKTVTKYILPFRIINSEAYSPIWNADYIDRVEVVMKEELDVVVRTQFYNENGIIRDVMQNHLTELFMLTAMDLPTLGGANISEIHELKYNLLNEVKFPKDNSILSGQYSTYNAEWLAESAGTNQVTNVPTFAATVLYVDSNKWTGVPFLLMSGKKLNEKASYVRIVFKDRKFCLNYNPVLCDDKRQIVFYIGGRLGELIAVSKGLPTPEVKSGWKRFTSNKNEDIFGQSVNDMHLFAPIKAVESYTELIESVIKGARHMFVPSKILYKSWEIWNSLLEISDNSRPRKYMGRNKDPERLDFTFETFSDGLKFVHDESSSPYVP